MQRDRSEVPSVERCRFIPIHEEHLVAGNDAAALPDWEHPSAVVALACHAHLDAIEYNGGAGAAHGLTSKRENALDKWYISREVTAVLECGRERFRRIRDHKRGDDQVTRWLHLIEPGGNAFGDVPNETRCRFWAEHGLDHGSGSYNGDKRDGTVCHEISFRRCSQA